ncbi:hypothetical protein Lesp02_23000 [Lentzea sp. NBRC 105346]|uniref:hypothetical protein n=1 Tax=Lentzea sp. NBRC 105346 TaxID=3032205 RepID=UPI0024A5D47A|nr:hypothetical protein [Lentzea sp. NBRC 105346]GLZ30110.1 hypothetical protein Lesp02_23000 [Lentzea sp. NBRC 105346]
MADPAELAGTFVVEVGERLRTPFLVFYSDERDYELRLDLDTHWSLRFVDTEVCAFLDRGHRWRLGLSGGSRRIATHHLEVLSRLCGMTVGEARRDSDQALRIAFCDRTTESTHLTVSGERTRLTSGAPWRLHRCLDTSLEIAWRLCAPGTGSARHALRS